MAADAAAREPLPHDALVEPVAHAIDPDNFTPRLVSLISNKLVWRESTLLRQRFGLGTNDWRVISALALRPGMTLTEISDFIAVNKAILSKSVTTLTQRELVVAADVPGRSRPLYLTAAGADIHEEMLPISMSGQELILDGLDPDQVARLNAVLRQLLARAEEFDLDAASLDA